MKDQAWRWRGPLLLISVEVGCGPSRPERTWASPPAVGMLCGRPLLAQAPFPIGPPVLQWVCCVGALCWPRHHFLGIRADSGINSGSRRMAFTLPPRTPTHKCQTFPEPITESFCYPPPFFLMLLVTHQLDFVSGFENPGLGDFVDSNHP